MRVKSKLYQSAGCVIIFAYAFASQLLHAEAPKRKVLIDDDSFSLMHMMLLGSDEVDVVGVVSVTGNSWANRVTAYALRGLELVGRTDVPVASGAMYPLLNTEKSTEHWEALYGRLLWKGVWMKSWVEDTLQTLPTYYGPNDPIDIDWGNPTTEPIPEIAANFMIQMVRKYPGEVTIIVGGPFTNVALAQRLDPEFASLAKELVYMGGSFNPQQMLDNEVAAQFAREFANSPRREFNIRLDPEAASIAARSPWKKITVIPVDPSTETQLDEELLSKVKSAAPEAMAEVFELWEPGFPLWDEIASAVWLDPTLVIEKETLFVDYNTQFGPSYGDTLSWSAGYEPGLGEQSAEVIRRIDREGLEALLLKNVGNLPR
ncbi:MAG: nucleoside hydrolase [Verrucomicrobiota bacterium]